MTLPVVRYPLDPTGVSSNNFVTGEVHATPPRTIRAVVTQYGAFFGKSLIVTDNATNQILNSTQYFPAMLYEQPTLQYGEDIYSLLMITDATVSNSVSLTYQALGGPFSTSQDALVEYINALNLDTRPVAWPAIINKPDGYTPSPHLHDIGNIYGFEYIVQALDRIREAILLGDAYYDDAVLKYIDAQVATFAGQISAVQASLTAHIQDKTNPHATTAAQVGAYTKAQSDTNLATLNSTLTTSIATVNTALGTHVADNKNPHSTTAAQVGAYTTAQTDAAIANVNVVINTNVATMQANLATHVNNTSNPHQVTAAQVGAYTKAQSDTNLNTAVSSLNTTMTNVNNNLVSHVLNKSNPHAVTAAQVGAYTTAQSDTNLSNAYSSLAAAINTKAPTRSDYAYLNTSCTFGDLVSTGTIICYNDIWAFYSDRRLKTNLEPITLANEKILSLNGYTYTHEPWFCEMQGIDPERQYAGLIAQEVQAVQPQIVGPAPFDTDREGNSISGENYLTLQYEKLTPLLVESQKETILQHRSLAEVVYFLEQRILHLEEQP